MPDGVAGNTGFVLADRVIVSSSGWYEPNPNPEDDNTPRKLLSDVLLGNAQNRTPEFTSFFKLTDFDFQVPNDVVIAGVEFLINVQQNSNPPSDYVYFTASLEFDGVESNQSVEANTENSQLIQSSVGGSNNLLGFTNLTPSTVNDITMSFTAYNSSSASTEGYYITSTNLSQLAIESLYAPSIRIWYVPPYYENELSVFSGELSVTSGKLSVL